MIDTKRLATDAAYWDECGAPEGATHYVAGSICPWEKRTGDEWWYFDDHEENWVRLQSDGDDRIKNSPAFLPVIPRPQATADDWVDGLPGVGVECESATRGAGYRVGHITYLSDQILVWMDKLSGHEYATRPHDREFRPIRTKEQRQREELQNLIEEHLDWGHSKAMSNKATDAILSRYNMEPKP